MAQRQNLSSITDDCKLAALINFIRGGKLDSFWRDFVSVSDERGSVINDYLMLHYVCSNVQMFQILNGWTDGRMGVGMI